MKNLFDLTDRVVVVTGGAGTLGRSFVSAFLQAGANVVIAEKDVE